MDYIKEISKEIRDKRISLNLSQAEVATIAGCKQQQVSRVESGKHNTGIELIMKIKNALGR